MADTLTPGNMPQQDDSPAWLCKNCGKFNPDSAKDCEHCGFVRDYDPDAKPDVDFAHFQEAFAEQEEQKRIRNRFYLDLAKVFLLLVLVITSLIFLNKLNRDWPFQSEFESDATSLADAVLTLKSHVEIGLTKGEYDRLLVVAVVEKEKFVAKYSDYPESQREAFIKLKLAAEYYELAKKAWDNQISEANGFGRIDPSVKTADANETVTNHWATAAQNLLLGLEDLR